MEVQLIEEQLRREQETLERGMEGMRVFLGKLQQAATNMAGEYDKCDLSTQDGVVRAIRIQTYRDIVTRELPRMMENIMNVDRPEDRKFSFWKWLGSKIR